MTSIVLPSMADVERVGRKGKNGAEKPIRRRLTVRTPAGKMSSTWLTVVHKEDPRQAILDKIGIVPDGLVQFSRILVAIYIPPIVTTTEGGIHLAPTIQDQDIEENRWQGKVGLCVALGPQAYVDDGADVKFHGQKIEVGDWVWFRPSDGMFCEVREQYCRMFDSERFIIGKLPHPDMVA